MDRDGDNPRVIPKDQRLSVDPMRFAFTVPERDDATRSRAEQSARQASELLHRGDGENDGRPGTSERAQKRMEREVYVISTLNIAITRYKTAGTKGEDVIESVRPFERDTWQRLGMGEKVQALNLAERILAASQQRPAQRVAAWPPSQEASKDGEHPMNRGATKDGMYVESERTIYIHETTLGVYSGEGDPRVVLDTYFHEARHAAIAQAVGKLRALRELRPNGLSPEQDKELQAWQTALEEHRQYLAMNEGAKKDQAYATIRIEQDANRDSAMRMEVYDRIRKS